MSKNIALLLVLVFLTASCIITFLPVQAEPRTIVVPDDYPTITDAVGNATEGDTIFIKSGTHEGPINQTIVIDKSISLIGENVENTIVNLHPKYNVTWIITASFYEYTDAIQIEANDVKLANLTLNFIGNMRSSGDRVQITGNVIWSHSTATGIFISGSECNIANNTFLGLINVEGSSNSVVENKAFSLTLKNAYRNFVCCNVFETLWLDSSNSNIISENNVSTGNVMWVTHVGNSSGNTFYDNYIEASLWNINLVVDYNSANNMFYSNAFISDDNPDYIDMYADEDLVVIDSSSFNNSWDNGSIGNYWSNYMLRYPKATEIDGSGIGDTPYVIDENNTDHYPLVNYTMNTTPSPSPSPSPTSTPTSTVAPTPTPTPEAEPFPTTLVAASITTVIIVGVGLLVYFKKRKR
jgi:hypothetical protein